MNPIKLCLMLAAALVAGCASAPEQLSASTGTQAAAELVGEIDPTVVTLEEITLNPGSVIVCREMLKQGSNVIVKTCMSRDDWVRYKRREARDAAAVVRFLQGSAFR